MTKVEAVTQLSITGTFDYAIPESFNDEIKKFIDNPPAHFIWSYDNSSFGFPRPLTNTGKIALQKYNRVYGTYYNTKINVIQEL